MSQPQQDSLEELMDDSKICTEGDLRSRHILRSSKEKKKRKTRSRVIKDEEDGAYNDPDYSPHQEMIEESSGGVSTCSTPIDEKMSHSSTPVSIVYPNSGTICALCYCGEKSLLGQGDLTQYDPTPGFNPFRKAILKRGSRDSFSGLSPATDLSDRSSKSPSRGRNRETRNSRDSSRQTEGAPLSVVQELSMLGCPEIADPANVFASTGHVTAHHCCAAWSEGVTQNELYQLLNVDKAVYQGMSSKCSYCNRYGATIKCKASRCDRLYHYPCAAGSGCFQDIKSMLMLCPIHLDQAPSIGAPEELNCAVCDDMGEISDFLFCTSCGHHYHGNCLQPFVEVNPVVRAGWQCPDCKICQTCRQPGDDNKMLVCDSCDKGYHTYCLEPAIPYIPTNGWCCQNCRRCADCGIKPDIGAPSIWNFSEEVCDSCFHQHDKGHCCPVCGKGYPEKIQHGDMMQCNICKKWVHDDCDDTVDLDAYYDMGADYACPKCRDDKKEMDTSATPTDKEPLSQTSLQTEVSVAAKRPAKRSSMSSSIESNKSTSGMKGSSTDPMLFAPQSGKTDDEKHMQTSDEAISIVTQQGRNVVERKVSGDANLAPFFAEQDPLSLFSNDAFQPIVSVPMLNNDEDSAKSLSEDWNKNRNPKQTTLDKSDLLPRPGIGKPGSIYGRGKPFGSKKKPPKSSKGKGVTKEKSRGTRRHRPSAAHSSSANIPSPGGSTVAVQGNAGIAASGMPMRRRSRARWSRQDSTLGNSGEVSHEVVDEEFGDSMHNTVVLCSADDAFTLSQDMCVVCGSFGQGIEGRLVACSQCGQCYHPYCVNLRLTKVVLRKGWRCLDCTVCEECGAADDPSHLLLCDDCDISYHTYCLKPPLLHVPKGGWKCKWCVRCVHCGTTSPGFNCDWAENYTSCGPCASYTHCPICRRLYRDEETIMQCSTCERWCHANCEYLYTESDIEKVLEKGYSCVFCRPKGSIPPHLDLNPPNAFEGDPSSGIYLGRTRSDMEQVKEYHKDGVALTSSGLQHIQQLMQSAMGLNKKKPNFQKRKSQLSKQVDKTALSLDIKAATGDLSFATSSEMEVKQSVKDEENSVVGELDASQGSQSELLSSMDVNVETPLSVDGGPPETPESQSSPVEVVDPLLPPGSANDLTKQALSGVQDAAIKRRRKPYRPGIGGFMVRQRNRGGLMNAKGKRNRILKAVPSLPTANFSSATGFERSPSKVEDVKLRASEITGECESSYIQHETEGGITIAHQDQVDVEMKDGMSIESKCEEQTSVLVSPLKLKISNLSQTQQKPKRKKRTRLIDQFPLYIQEGFFGTSVLDQARAATRTAIDLFEEKKSTSKPSCGGTSRIILPERVKLRLDAQVAMKNAETKRRAELKQRSLQSNDDDALNLDKESEDLLGVLPDDLPFKEDEILGMLSAGQGNGSGNDSHENLLSPSALETLMTDGLAGIDGDVTSLFSDVLNNEEDGVPDEHNLLKDIGNLTEPTKTSTSVDLLESTLRNTTQTTSSNAFNIDPTNEIMYQINQDLLSNTTGAIKQEQQSSIVAQKQAATVRQTSPHLQQQLQQQQLQMQQAQQQQLNVQQMQQAGYNIQPHMQPSMQMMNKHLYRDLPVSDPSYIGTQQAQHTHFPTSMQQPRLQQIPLQTEQQPQQQQQTGMQIQQQKFIRHVPGGTAIPQNIPISNMPMGPQAHSPLHHHGMMQRQHSVGTNPGQMEMQQTPSGQIVFGPQHHQTMQKQQMPPQAGAPVGQISQSPGLLTKMENTGVDQSGQVAVQSLPDLTREPNLFEPAPTPWPLCTDLDGDTLSVNQRNILKWEKDEPLGVYATISPVLYANMKHAYLKKEYPDWPTRAKQIAKLWRKATPEERAPFLQKARDNRAYLKSSRRDLVEVHEQDDQDEEEKSNQILGGIFSGRSTPTAGSLADGHLGSHGTPMESPSHLFNPQHAQQPIGDGRGHVKMSSSPASDYNTFVKPKPPSRDPTPKPQSPGLASSNVVSVGRSKSPFPTVMSPSGQLPGSARTQGYPAQRQWGDVQGHGTSPQQQAVIQAQPWSNQQQTSLTQQSQQSLRMPKVENVETSNVMPAQTMQFPQSYHQGTLSQNVNVPLGSAGKHSSLQRQDSAQEIAANSNPDQYIVRSITPRPGVPPQLLPQIASPVVQMDQHPVSQSPVRSHPAGQGIRTPGSKINQPGSSQPLGSHYSFQEVDKTIHRWPSTSSDQEVVKHQSETIGNVQGTSSVPQSPVAGTSRLPSSSDDLPLPSNDNSETILNQATATSGRPQIRDMLIRRSEQRRYKLLEQQTFPGGSWVPSAGTVVNRPPPPYPSPSPIASTQNSFTFPPCVRPDRFVSPQHQNTQMGDSRVRAPRPANIPPSSPSCSPGFSGSHIQNPANIPSFGVERLPSRTSTSSSSVTGIHPIAGQSSVVGGFIELRHSKHSDPAVRRERLIRAGAALPSTTSTASDVKPSIVSSLKSTSTNTAATSVVTPKSEPVTDDNASFLAVSQQVKNDKPSLTQLTPAAAAAAATTLPSSSSVIDTPSSESIVSAVSSVTTSAEANSTMAMNDSLVTAAITSNSTPPECFIKNESAVTNGANVNKTVNTDYLKPEILEKETSTSEVEKISSNEEITQQSIADSNEAADHSPTSDESAPKEREDSAITSVSNEHSYVKTLQTYDQEQSTNEKQTELCTDLTDNKTLISSDGLIHGVGLTPPPDTTLAGNASSPEDGLIVSNVIVVEKESKSDSPTEDLSPATNSVMSADSAKVSETADTIEKPAENLNQVSDGVKIKQIDKEVTASLEACINKVADFLSTSENNFEKMCNDGSSEILSPCNSATEVSQSRKLQASAESASKQEAGSASEQIAPTVVDANKVDIETLHGTCVTVQSNQSTVSSLIAQSTVTVTSATSADTIVTQAIAIPSTLTTSHPSVSNDPVPTVTPALPNPPSGHAPSVLAAASALPSKTQFQVAQPHASPLYPPPRPKPLLIKEQPLLLQDLLDEEKQEQERAKMEKRSQDYPSSDNSTLEMDRIRHAKMKLLTGIAQVIKGTSQAGIEGVSSSVPIMQRSVGAWPSQPSVPHAVHVSGPTLMNDTPAGNDKETQQKAQYEEWLIQHQALLQMQVKNLEQTAQQYRTTKQVLTKKQRQSKKNGEEFSQADAQKLTQASKQAVDVQQQLEEVKKQQLRHSELVQNYNAKQGPIQPYITPAPGQHTVLAQGVSEVVRMGQPHFQQQSQIPQGIVRQQSVPVQPTNQVSTCGPTAGFSVTLPSTAASQQTMLLPGHTQSGNLTESRVQIHQDVSHFQKTPPNRQGSHSEMTQLIVQHSSLPITSAQPMPKHGTPESSKVFVASQALVTPTQATQMMLPVSINLRPNLSGQIDPTHGHFIPAHVSSVNINTGGNMATKGPIIRQMVPSSPLATSDPSLQIHQLIPVEGQIKSPAQEKPKRKRKKPKSASVSENAATISDPRFVMAHNMIRPGLPGLDGAKSSHIMSGPPQSFVQMPPVFMTTSVMQTFVTSPAATVPSSQFLQELHNDKNPNQAFSMPAGLLLSQHGVASSVGAVGTMHTIAGTSQSTVFYHGTPQQGTFQPGAKMKASPEVLATGKPVSASNLKTEIGTPSTKHTKPRFSPVQHPLPPLPLASKLSDAEVEIVLATDPDAQSNSSTPDSKNSISVQRDLLGSSDDIYLDERTENLLDQTINDVIRSVLVYTEKKELAKETGGKVALPHCLRIPKHPKVIPKTSTPQHSPKVVQNPFLGAFAQPGVPRPTLHNNHQELLRVMLKTGSNGLPGSSPINITGQIEAFGEIKKSEFGASNQSDGSSYEYMIGEDGKKKRVRNSSKDKDGKEKPKKKKKKKRQSQDEDQVFAQDPQKASQGVNFSKHPHKSLSTDQSQSKQAIPWKPLPLLPLVEPDMQINYSMCMPKETGIAMNKSLLEGSFGSATLRGLPDYYDLLRCKDPFVYMHPPTPPSSLPPSPKRDHIEPIIDRALVSNQHVKVPDSLPTPPHQAPDIADDFYTPNSNDEIPPSSPELEDDKQQFSNNFLCARTLLYKDISDYQVPSPVLAVQLLPDKDAVDENDEISVTISFKSENTKIIKKSLSRLSRALGTSIISFKLEDTKKSGKKEIQGENDRNKNSKMLGDSITDSGSNSINRRRCSQCDQVVIGNGVRKPMLEENNQEEDIIYCNKDCYFKSEFEVQAVKVETTNVKKKWKASQIYQKHTRKIDITSLINANPDPEYVSTRGRSVSFTPGGPDGADDGGKSADGKGRGRGRRRGSTGPGDDGKAGVKRWKGIKWKKWSVSVANSRTGSQKAPADIDALLSKYGTALKPPPDMVDTRKCVLCGTSGDGDTKGVARLLNLDVDQWVHLNCALWSAEVYETQGGALINVDLAVRNGHSASCVVCFKKGATIRCQRSRCVNVYHCACALSCGCQFYKDKTVLCPSHVVSAGGPGVIPPHHDQLKTLAVFRKVYVQRKETKQIASIMQQGELTQGEKNYILRVGALMFYAVGQLSTHQMAQFHSKSAIFPVGYKATRIYWSSNNTRKRCKYMCMICEKDGKPWFITRYQAVAFRSKAPDKTAQGEWMEMTGDCVKGQWSGLLEQLANLRNQQKMLKLFPAYINGENIFGLTSPGVCRILESLPNIELCANYKFRYGRSPILEVPLAINPTGCARSEPHIKHSRKKPHTLISNLISEYYESTGIGDASTSLYGKQFVHSKSSQYRRMKQEWRNNVNLARSRIQGLGLFASRDIEPGTMVIEYIGQIIRSEVAEKREKKYEAANRGVYMFRLDSDYIVDATVTGGPARYINHSCNPNCVAEVVNFEKEKKIMIISNRLILSGEELNYDYKFDFEDDGNKIPCLCGSINCRKWMN